MHAGDEEATQSAVGAQNVIEWLSGTWALVEDAVSARRYHWNSHTNEVSWEVPPGVQAASCDARSSPVAATATRGDTGALDGAGDRSGPVDAAGQPSSGRGVDGGASKDERPEGGASRSGQDKRDLGSAAHTASEEVPEVGGVEGAVETLMKADVEDGVASARGVAQPGSGGPAPEAAVAELPEGWVRLWHDDSAQPYYWHEATGVMQWQSPVDTWGIEPLIVLPPDICLCIYFPSLMKCICPVRF